MQGKKIYQEKLFVNFQLSEHIPADNIYRKISELIDLEFLYRHTASYYGREGRKGIDPVVFMKFMLVGYLENINSDRRIVEVSRLRLDILFFLGYDLGEALPWHSTLSRTRQLYGQQVFTQVFRAVLKQCIDKGMLSGRRQAVDGFFIKANASLDGMLEREVLEDAERFARELQENSGEFSPRTVKIPEKRLCDRSGRPPRRNAHNDTHCSRKDPEAKLSVKRGKAMALNYLGEVCVDTQSRLITHIEAFTAEKHDGQCLPGVMDRLVSSLGHEGLHVDELLADRGFSTGEALKALEELGITGYIPNRPQFRPDREGFTYHPQGDYYTCPNQKKLFYKEDAGCNCRRYKSGRGDCKGCPLQQNCSGYKEHKKSAEINVSIDRNQYMRMHQRMQTPKALKMMRIRQSTVEPVIGTLTNFMALRKLNTIGLIQANKCVTMAGTAFNLKKLIKYIQRMPPKICLAAKAVKKDYMAFLPPFYHHLNTLKNHFYLSPFPRISLK